MTIDKNNFDDYNTMNQQIDIGATPRREFNERLQKYCSLNRGSIVKNA